MALFNSPKKLAQETAQQLIAGHVTLLAVWALHNAGVFAAMASSAGLNAPQHALDTNMSAETLSALLDYLTQRGLVAKSGSGVDERFVLTATGAALLEHEAGVLDHVRSYQPIMAMLEHHLARLKVQGVARKGEVAVAGQVRRYRAEVYPAIAKAVARTSATHLLDLQCDGGELLVHLAEHEKKLAGVGVSSDGALVRQANDLISAHNLEKRLIAIPAAVFDVCLETRETFARAGITPQLWEKFDCLVACNVFSDLWAQNRDRAAAALRQIPLSFPGVALVLAEPCAGKRFERNYYAPEADLMLRLSRSALLTDQQWRDELQTAGFTLVSETALATDGVTVFHCKPTHTPAPKPIPPRQKTQA